MAQFYPVPVGGMDVFVLQSRHMDDTPITKRPWFYIAGWLVILLALYGWQISRMGGVQSSLFDILLDLICVFPALLLLWMAFFAQFVLPVSTFRDRQKIFDRLLADLFGGHGSALFIENGKIRERPGESDKKGPGVVWLDSASAAVTRTATAIKQVLGPGVHFIDAGETIAGTIDLHTQTQSLGPRENENPFAEKTDKQTDEEYAQIQDRRKMVSAWTRDGLEVIPSISISFRVNTGFPKENEPGSRFGYRMGASKKAQEVYEKADQEIIRKAVIGQGVNLNAPPDSPRRRLAWNELPASLAVDVWREYVAKFTRDELFSLASKYEDVEIFSQTSQKENTTSLTAINGTKHRGLVAILKEINSLMDWAIGLLEEKRTEKQKEKDNTLPKTTTSELSAPNIKKEKTALQVINEMVKARLTQSEVVDLDDTGENNKPGKLVSNEYNILYARGLKVLNVSISNPRFHPKIEEKVINQWSATWLNNAKAESDRIERKRDILETATREQVQIDYAVKIGKEINGFASKEEPKGKVRAMLKTLIFRSRGIIRSGSHSDKLRRRLSNELQDIEEMIKWVEANGK